MPEISTGHRIFNNEQQQGVFVEGTIHRFNATEGVFVDQDMGYVTHPSEIALHAGAGAVYLDITSEFSGLVQLALKPEQIFPLIRALNDAHLEQQSRYRALDRIQGESDK